MSSLDMFLSGMQEFESQLLIKCLPTMLLRAGEQGTYLDLENISEERVYFLPPGYFFFVYEVQPMLMR